MHRRADPDHRDRAIDGLRAPALPAVPDSPGWILARAAWLPVFAGFAVFAPGLA